MQVFSESFQHDRSSLPARSLITSACTYIISIHTSSICFCCPHFYNSHTRKYYLSFKGKFHCNFSMKINCSLVSPWRLPHTMFQHMSCCMHNYGVYIWLSDCWWFEGRDCVQCCLVPCLSQDKSHKETQCFFNELQRWWFSESRFIDFGFSMPTFSLGLALWAC